MGTDSSRRAARAESELALLFSVNASSQPVVEVSSLEPKASSRRSAATRASETMPRETRAPELISSASTSIWTTVASSAKRRPKPKIQLNRPPNISKRSAWPSARERAPLAKFGWSSGTVPRAIGEHT